MRDPYKYPCVAAHMVDKITAAVFPDGIDAYDDEDSDYGDSFYDSLVHDENKALKREMKRLQDKKPTRKPAPDPFVELLLKMPNPNRDLYKTIEKEFLS